MDIDSLTDEQIDRLNQHCADVLGKCLAIHEELTAQTGPAPKVYTELMNAAKACHESGAIDLGLSLIGLTVFWLKASDDEKLSLVKLIRSNTHVAEYMRAISRDVHADGAAATDPTAPSRN